jgi:hypothetical protein
MTPCPEGSGSSSSRSLLACYSLGLAAAQHMLQQPSMANIQTAAGRQKTTIQSNSDCIAQHKPDSCC